MDGILTARGGVDSRWARRHHAPASDRVPRRGAGSKNRTANKATEVSVVSGPPLAILTDIEARKAWPECLELYRETMLSIARDLRSDGPRREERRLELQVLLERELQALLMCRQENERRARRDALNELVSDVMGLAESLEAASGKLTEHRAPNFVSFFKAKLIWKANDVLESEYRRHERRVYPVADPYSLRPIESQSVPGARRNERRVLVREIFATFGGDPTDSAVLVGLMQDVPIAEIARRTGRSRQQIYRLLERIRNWSEGSRDE